MKKKILSLMVGGLILTGMSTVSNAAPAIDDYFEIYNISKTGYTGYLTKQKTGSNAVCNNSTMSGINYHTAQLVNSENKYRSSVETVSKGERQVLNVGVYDGTKAQAGYKYKQRHVVPSLGSKASGTFSVDDKNDF